MEHDKLTCETVGKGLYVYISSEHRFGTDSFLLADFSAPRHKDLVCDLGCGCGIIPILFQKHYQPKQVWAIDIQPKAIDLTKRGIASSNLEDRIIPKLSDLNDLKNMPFQSFDLVCCNPPYKALGSGVMSNGKSDRLARHETACNIEGVCRAANKLLKFGGRLCICQRAERLVDTVCAMRKYDLEPKIIRFCAKDELTAPWMFLIEGKKGSKPFLRALKTLRVYDKDGEFTNEMKSIYGQED